jgi:hypothetical protein
MKYVSLRSPTSRQALMQRFIRFITFLTFIRSNLINRMNLRNLRNLQKRPGFIFLLMVLAVGALVTATTVSLILLGLAGERTGYSVVRSAQALELARLCAERALRELRVDNRYAGGVTVTVGDGTCTLQSIGGSGNNNRTVCAEGRSGGAVRRLEIAVEQIQAPTRITSWRAVQAFSLCP